jgi:amino acid permease
VYGLQKINVSFDHIDYWKSSGMFHAVPIYALAFACHLQLVAIIKELLSGEVHEGDTQNGPRAKVISKWSVIIVGTVYGSVALFGHIAFVTSGVNGDILSNFDDGLLAQSTRIGFTLSVIVSFPFMVNPCRAVVHSFMYGKIDHIPGSRHLYITLLIITISFIVAVCTPNGNVNVFSTQYILCVWL